MLRVLNVHYDDFVPTWHNPRTHVEYHIFVVVTDGRLHYRLNGTSQIAERGDLLFIPAGTEREAFNVEAPHRKYAVLFLGGADCGLPLLAEREPVIVRSRHVETHRQHLAAMYREALEKRPYSEQALQGMLLTALAAFCRERESPALPRRRAQQVELLQSYLLEHYRRAVSLQELAALIRRSPNYTLSLFREAVGRTPLDYLHALRIRTAQDLLRQTDATVAAIAEHLGYCDAASFSKTFKKHTGQSPAYWRAGLVAAQIRPDSAG